MAKVLLIEDDNNLREIFAMRLEAEGYDTMSAADGEEGLVVAMKQKPDLIIADVMMPKLSGFEMLETLRATPEMSSTKVIMMTALGQAEDQARGEKLGVVKYLVKSQVTLEDFVRVVRGVLQPDDQAKGAADSPGEDQAKPTNNLESEQSMQDDSNSTNQTPPAGGDQPQPTPMADGADPASGQVSTADEQATVQSQVNDFASSPAAAPAEPATPPADPSAMPAEPAAPADGADEATASDSGDSPATPPVDPSTSPPAAV